MLQPDFLVNFRSGVSCNTEKNLINSRVWIQTALNIVKGVAFVLLPHLKKSGVNGAVK